jgi:hypothetical protein
MQLERRLTSVEQILPTLATKTDLEIAIAPLATRVEMREEAEQTRRHFDVVAEAMDAKFEVLAEGLLAAQQRTGAVRDELKKEVTVLDGRVTRLEAWLATRRKR